jgi:hypothetical protein
MVCADAVKGVAIVIIMIPASVAMPTLAFFVILLIIFFIIVGSSFDFYLIDFHCFGGLFLLLGTLYQSLNNSRATENRFF